MFHEDIKTVEGKAKYSKSELEELYSSALKFLVPLSSKETYRIIIRQINRLFNTQFGSVYINNRGNLVNVYSSSSKIRKIRIRENGYTYRAFRDGKASVISVGSVRQFHPQLIDMGIKSIVFIPLVYKNTKMGVISCDSFKVLDFDKNQLHLLSLFGALSMLAIRKSQLHDELAESLKTRDLFISMASHEFRSPLTTINSYAQLIENALLHDKKVNYKWSKVLSLETTRMIHMVNELLQLDTIKSGKLRYNWRPCNLDDVLLRAIVNFEVRHPERSLTYKNRLNEGKGDVMADTDKLLQAILNLLNNAAKFSSDEIIMELSYKRPYFYISVIDKGEGIASDDLGRIFEGFYKGQNATKAGIGLGLYLAKSIVQMHRGKVQIVSEKGVGTRVELLLPRIVYGQ